MQLPPYVIIKNGFKRLSYIEKFANKFYEIFTNRLDNKAKDNWATGSKLSDNDTSIQYNQSDIRT